MDKLIAWLDGERGRRVFLAAQLHIGPSALSQWSQVPAERCLDVERITGISRHELRPDIYGAARKSDTRPAA
jgi:DNA-binding transcriptional regulator YdaS (Cro superfamily)